jgi:hypothetical protein
VLDTVPEPSNRTVELESVFDIHVDLVSEAAAGRFVSNKFQTIFGLYFIFL